MGFIINPYLVQPSGPTYGTLTTAWIAATGETDLTILGALNTLETDLITYGLTSKIKALYPMVGGTSTKHSYNFINTAQFQLSFNGGWTHSSTGALPNGSNAFANTSLTPSISLALNSMHLSFYSRTNITALQVDMGSSDNSNGQAFVNFNYGSQRYTAINRTGQLDSLLPNTTGFLIENRRDANFHQTFRNGSLFSNVGWPSQVLNSYPIYIGSINTLNNAQQHSSKQCALASIGDGLTDTEAANFYTAVQAFQTTLSRNV